MDLPHIDIGMSEFTIHSVSARFAPHAYDQALWCLVIDCKVNNLEGGSGVTLTRNVEQIPKKSVLDYIEHGHLNGWIRHHVEKVVLHEVSECLRVDGERITDPHPEDPAWHERTKHRRIAEQPERAPYTYEGFE